MKKTKTQKGITLIALIITIVVLMILAVVTINSVKDGGIITHAQNAASDYTIAQEKEQIGLALSEWQIQKAIPGNTKSFSEVLTSELGDVAQIGAVAEDGSITITMNKTQNQYKINEDGTLEGPLEEDIVTPPPSGGDGNPLATYLTQDDAELEKLATGVSLVKYEDLEAGSTLKTLADNGKVIAVLTDGTYKAVIPSGFSILTTSEDGETIAGGLVVVDEQGNEFVWVPVTDTISTTGYYVSTELSDYSEPSVVGGVNEHAYGGYEFDAVESNLRSANCEDIDVDGTLEMSDFETELKNIYKEMAESVNECNGFYVGRYEVSFNESRKAQSKGSTETVPVYSAINMWSSSNDNNAGTWYGLYALCKTYNTSSVKSSMIWGIQYDKMIEWMGNDATNFNLNYMNKDSQRRTGYVSTDIIRNVYDLGGNSFEWTLEASKIKGSLNNRFRATRGGCYNFFTAGFSPVYKSSEMPGESEGYRGSRLALYIV